VFQTAIYRSGTQYFPKKQRTCLGFKDVDHNTKYGVVWFGGLAWSGMVWNGVVWCGVACCVVWHVVWCGSAPLHAV